VRSPTAQLPEIATHLASLHVPVSLLTLPPFMCLFVSYVPWKEALLVLDNFFAGVCEGGE
jgi:hypothetical protein